MKRREAIQGIAILSTSITFFQSCDFENYAVYENIPLERPQRKLLNQFIVTLLPDKEGVEIVTPESSSNYVLTIINDCYSPKDIQKYITGFMEFQTHLENKYNKSFNRLEQNQKLELFRYCSQSDDRSELLKYFYDTSKVLVVQHFTSSNYFMVNYLDFEFIPGRFLGCVPV